MELIFFDCGISFVKTPFSYFFYFNRKKTQKKEFSYLNKKLEENCTVKCYLIYRLKKKNKKLFYCQKTQPCIEDVWSGSGGSRPSALENDVGDTSIPFKMKYENCKIDKYIYEGCTILN